MFQDAVKDRFDAVRGRSSEDILAALGLERKRSTLSVTLLWGGLFAAGVIVGTGVALLFAPKSGRQVRQDIKERVSALVSLIGVSAGRAVHGAREAPTDKAEETSPSNGTSKPSNNGAPTAG